MNAAVASHQNLFLDLQRQGQTNNIRLQTPAPSISHNIWYQSPEFVQGRNKDKGEIILSHLLAFLLWDSNECSASDIFVFPGI